MVTEPDQSSPDAPAGPSNLSTCWTPERLAIKVWLNDLAPSLAELYEGAVGILLDRPIPGYTRLVGHAVREIGNRLPVVKSGESSSRLDYKFELDRIVGHWKKAGLGTSGSAPTLSVPDKPNDALESEVKLPAGLVIAIGELLSKHEAVDKKRTSRAEEFFTIIWPENKKHIDTVRPAIKQWLDVTQWFMRITHDIGRIDSQIDTEELRGKFILFEESLTTFTLKYFETTDELDDILEEANS